MKGTVVALLVFTAYAASAVPVEEKLSHDGYPRYIHFPDGEGVMHDVDLEETPDTELLTEVSRNPANNLYQLYTINNPTDPQTLIYNDLDSIYSSNFNPHMPVVVIVHGWLSNQNTNMNPVIRDAFLSKGNYNVIVMDWRRLAISGYVTAVRGVPEVGRGLGQFLGFLSYVTGAPLNSMHLIGFSLGAHLVGNAGRELEGKVARITGLDPAGPLWSGNANRLNSNDAVYVEAIHTDGGYTIGGLGIGTAVADADFFPNGGISQPGCLTSICNHNRAWELFVATMEYNHLVATKCSSTLQITLNTCRGEQLRMGNEDLQKWGSGWYRVNTDRKYPF